MSDSTLLRRVNESALLELLREEGPIARSELARRLHLSPATVTRIVAEMIEQGTVLERSAGDSTGGRRPTLLEFNARASLIVGVYVGGQYTSGALADLDGEILARRALPTLPGDAGVRQLVSVIRALLDEAAELGICVRGVCVGAPSVVTHPGGEVLLAPSLGWRNLPLRRILEEQIGLPTFVENEVNLIALGERWRGAGQGLGTIVCLSLGAGIGAGIVLDGRLYRGSHHAAGEVGYVIPSERFLGGVYSLYGCLEGLAGYEGIVRRTREAIRNGDKSTLPAGALSVGDVLKAARDGDPAARFVLDETIDYLTIAVANLACILDPDRVILSGEMADYGDLLLEPIRARMQGLVPVVPDIVLSELKIDALTLGAVVAALRATSGSVQVTASRA